jgi:pimeloyl-ACP methyl ester carboxylesterase
MTMERQRLVELTNRFMDAFNRNDLDAVMSFFADNAVYDEFNGTRNEGKEAIRTAFEPQFTGAFGKMKFIDEDLFVDADTGKVMASWLCTLEVKGRPGLARAARGMLAQFDSAAIDSLPKITVPTLVIVGSEDTLFLGATEYMAKKIAGARRVVIDGAGHVASVDRPEPFNAALLAFLDEVTGA